MQTNDFEQAFGAFIDSREYDETQNSLFSLVRKSFMAGWQAAGGHPPVPHKIFDVIITMKEQAKE